MSEGVRRVMGIQASETCDSSQLLGRLGKESNRTLIRTPTQKPPRYHTVFSRMAPSNAGTT